MAAGHVFGAIISFGKKKKKKKKEKEKRTARTSLAA